jgi:drug/metabolite transporter (DMT)-like permease
MQVRNLGAMVLLATIWGVSFLLIRIAAPALGPLALTNARMLIAGVLLLGYAMWKKWELPSLRQRWRDFLALAALNSILPLSLEAFAVVHLNASLAAILGTTTPLFTALVATIWLHEQLRWRKSFGLMVGFFGVALLVGWSPFTLTPVVMLAVGAALLASFLYALASVYTHAKFVGTGAVPLAIGQELSAGIILIPVTLAIPPVMPPSVAVIMATITLALVMTAGGNLLYFSLIERVGPTQTQTVSFLVPIVALGAGVVLFDEPLTATMIIGFGVIVVSLLLVMGDGLPSRSKAVRAADRMVSSSGVRQLCPC